MQCVLQRLQSWQGCELGNPLCCVSSLSPHLFTSAHLLLLWAVSWVPGRCCLLTFIPRETWQEVGGREGVRLWVFSPLSLAVRSPWADWRSLLSLRCLFAQTSLSGIVVAVPPSYPSGIGWSWNLRVASPEAKLSLGGFEYSVHTFVKSSIIKPFSNCPVPCGDPAPRRPLYPPYEVQHGRSLLPPGLAVSEAQWRRGVCLYCWMYFLDCSEESVNILKRNKFWLGK